MKTPRNLLLGITGGIAAYKIPELIRRVKEHGDCVRVILTEGAQHFVTPATLQAVSGEPVARDIWESEKAHGMGHIALAKWADQILIAPATADCIARLAQGRANDLLSTVCLATEAPIALAPAMNRVMWEKPAVQDNVVLLKKRGLSIWGPGSGPQACGDVGPGRMLEVDDLLRLLALDAPSISRLSPPVVPHLSPPVIQAQAGIQECNNQPPLADQTLLITAGPTREPIDPVRYLTNRSSGKMGYALAEAAQQLGARVILVSGPSSLPVPTGAEVIFVETASEMRKAVFSHLAGVDIFISTAAVSDYRVKDVSAQKIKKSDQPLSLGLVQNPDILKEVAALKQRPFCVGFAAETHAIKENARRKLIQKNLDMIVANDVSNGQVFDQAENSVWYQTAEGKEDVLGPLPKVKLAEQLLGLISSLLHVPIA